MLQFKRAKLCLLSFSNNTQIVYFYNVGYVFKHPSYTAFEI